VEAISRPFRDSEDPWSYERNPVERERFRDQTELLDSVRGTEVFGSVLEIGCAGGVYTEILSQRCKSLLALDLSPAALEIAQRRCEPIDWVRFERFDLRLEQIPGKFDLVVVAGVLEYFNRQATMRHVRQKLVEALKPGGYLLVETTRRKQLENSWWGRWLRRGRWINEFVGKHPFVSIDRSVLTDSYAITLYRKYGKVAGDEYLGHNLNV
jgi:SAM-dependent methyltransferase